MTEQMRHVSKWLGFIIFFKVWKNPEECQLVSILNGNKLYKLSQILGWIWVWITKIWYHNILIDNWRELFCHPFFQAVYFVLAPNCERHDVA